MGNTICEKCGINKEYYNLHGSTGRRSARKNNYQIRRSCRYHTFEKIQTNANDASSIVQNICLDCENVNFNCYHKWKYSLWKYSLWK